MKPETLSFRLIKEIKDDRFDEEKLHQYVALIHIGPRDIQFAAADSTDSRCLLLQDFVLGISLDSEDYFEQLQSLFDSHPVLMAGFWKQVKVSFKNSNYVQVPAGLFEPSAAASYLQLNVRADLAQEEVRWCGNPASGSITVFTCPKKVTEWLTGLYKNTRLSFYHQSSALIEGLLKDVSADTGSTLYLYVDRFKLHILAQRGGQLVFYNQYSIRQFPDYIKYITLALDGLNMKQESSEVRLWGYLGKNSPHYHEFYKYIRTVRFGGRPTYMNFGYFFDEIQDHQFTDLFGLYLLP